MLSELHSEFPMQVCVLLHTQVVEEQVGPEGRHSLELDPADLALVEAAEGPGRGSLEGRDQGLLVQSYPITRPGLTAPGQTLLGRDLHAINRLPLVHWSDGDTRGETVLQSAGGPGQGGLLQGPGHQPVDRGGDGVNSSEVVDVEAGGQAGGGELGTAEHTGDSLHLTGAPHTSHLTPLTSHLTLHQHCLKRRNVERNLIL